MIQFILIHLLLVSTIGNVITKRTTISGNIQDSDIDKIVVGILRRCFVSEGITIGFIGELSSSIITLNTTFSNLTAKVLFVNSDKALKDVDNRSATFSYGLSVFVLGSSDRYSADQLLLGLKKTRWWNHEAFFITLDQRKPTEKIACDKKARESLLITWKMDILSSIFICTFYGGGEENSVFVYTFNPYKETAPNPWTKVESLTIFNDHPWTLFEQPYDLEKTTCDSIKFTNKTGDLNGFAILANAKPVSTYLTIHSGWKSIDDLGGNQAPILRAVWKKLNASISLKTYDSNVNFGNSFNDGSATGLIADIVSDRCDINLNRRYIRRQWGIRFSIAARTSGLYIITNHRGWKSSLTKITDFIRYELVLAVFLICIVTVLLTGYSPSRFTLPNLMNIPRLFLNTGMIGLSKSTSQRFLLFATMLMVLIIHSLVQGKMAQILTSQISNQQVDTINDVQEFDYQIYGYGHLSDSIPPNLANRFHRTKLIHHGFCLVVLANNSNAACIAPAEDISIYIAHQNLYISKSTFQDFHESYTTRKNWPLYDRFNTLMERLIDTGLTLYWDSKTPDLQEMRKRLIKPVGRILRYKDLIFALKILAVGLAISTLIFFFEMVLAN